MSEIWNPSEHPYDPELICFGWRSTYGCSASVTRNGELDACGNDIVAFRRWYPGEGYETEPPEQGWYDGVCKRHVAHDMIPLALVLDALKDAPLPCNIRHVDPVTIRAAVSQLDAGCTGIVKVNGELKRCGRPSVALRVWSHDELFDPHDELETVIAGCCKTHTCHDVIRLASILEALR
ncbi:hypothetical protein [Bifidobacterium sp. SO1]|uniref:hypothetical protein n=1 Tax=Bifidobacterium sp. SO1 TaxID=2809029 RepID=UPI001BDD813C|nr:hypothetical protein [Bifidobacterium sp. SO1]MBT1162881.1 hypothetical protein [Bifidobacterium sp. SO1]